MCPSFPKPRRDWTEGNCAHFADEEVRVTDAQPLAPSLPAKEQPGHLDRGWWPAGPEPQLLPLSLLAPGWLREKMANS